MVNFIKRNGSFIGFLFMEILALVAINLGDFSEIWVILGFLGAIFLIPYVILFEKKDKLALLLFTIPFILYIAFTAFSRFFITNSNILSILVSFVGPLSFIFAGISLKQDKDFKMETALLVLFGALAFITSISLIVTLANYGPFYAQIYAGRYIYYDGEMLLLSHIGLWISQITNAQMMSIDFVNVYALVLASCLPALLFISPRKNLKRFVLFAIFGGLGLLTLIFTPSFKPLIVLFVGLLFALYVRFVKKNNIGRWIINVLAILALALFLIVFVILIMNAQSGNSFESLKSFISSNGLLNYLFNENRYAQNIKLVLDFSNNISNFNNGGVIGFLFGSTRTYGQGTGSFIFDVINEAGFFAFISLITFIVFAFISLQRYLRFGKGPMHVKMMIVLFVASYFVYTLFFYHSIPYTVEGRYMSYSTFPLTLVAFFFIGYSFTYARKAKDLELKEATPLNEEKVDDVPAEEKSVEIESSLDTSIFDEIEEEKHDEK